MVTKGANSAYGGDIVVANEGCEGDLAVEQLACGPVPKFRRGNQKFELNR